jgi:peptidoglycan biosynthesis protein MviN/MurJ (putative lipid II flippase)
MVFHSKDNRGGFPISLAQSVTLATLANLTGRAANVAIPIAVITVCGADKATDLFFFVLAGAFYFYGILANAVTQSTTPLLINDDLVIGRKPVVMIALYGTLTVFSVALAVNALLPPIHVTYVLALALMAGAGVANGVVSGQWHAGERFAPPGFSWSLRLIPLLCWLAGGGGSQTLPLLALGIGVADCLRCAALIIGRRRHGQTSTAPGTVFSPSVLATYGAVILSALINGLNPLIDRVIANLSGPGGISVLEAGERIYMLLASLSTMGIGMVLLTRLSQDVSGGTLDKSWPKILRFVGLWVVVWLTAGILIGAWGLTWWLEAATGLTSGQLHASVGVYVYYLAGLPFFALALVYVKRLQSLQRWWVMVVTSSVTVALNIPMSLLLYRVMGIPGIALATTCIHMVNCMILIAAAHRKRTAAPDLP